MKYLKLQKMKQFLEKSFEILGTLVDDTWKFLEIFDVTCIFYKFPKEPLRFYMHYSMSAAWKLFEIFRCIRKNLSFFMEPAKFFEVFVITFCKTMFFKKNDLIV